MNRKIWKALGIAVCMLALAAPRAMAKTYKVGKDAPFIKFWDAVQEINDESSDEKNEIVLYDEIELTSGQMLTRGQTTIKGNGHQITISNAGITVTGGKTVLNLGAEGYDGTLTIDGNESGAFVFVSGGATANMYEHVTLQNWKPTSNACVVIIGSDPVTNSKSVFNMYGGVIENCSRVVTADSGTTFHMQGGKILNCVSENNGGGVRLYEATFIMEGGTISGCTAVNGRGGGLYAYNSTLTIERGTISGCTADEGGGLYAINSSTNSSTVNISGGTISGCTAVIGNGGGLYVDGSTITIEDGTISGCKALWSNNKGNGGGLYANNSAINISDGTISGCEGRWGGGLYAENSSTITIIDSTISGCKAGAGGGLCVVGSTLNIKDDIISECFVSDTGKGGGLYAENNSILTISGGTIKGNKAAYGGGVALKDSRVKEEEPITSWTVVDNEAYKTDTGSGYIGGGIYLESGSMDVSNGSNKIYNNTADGHGADICLTDDTSSIKLPNAANMGAKYLDSGIYIDGWYNDDNPRYTPSESGVPVKVDGAEPLKGALSLVASYKAIPMCTVTIDANGGVGGSSSQTVQKGTTVTLEAPTKEGHLFKGWKDGEKVYRAGETITVTGDMTLTAVWEARTFTVTYVLLDGKTRTETAAYGQNVTLVEEPRTGYTFVGWKDGEKVYHAGETITVTGDMTLTAEWKKLPSAENLPKTGDESPVLLWGVALAVSAAACFMLRRRK